MHKLRDALECSSIVEEEGAAPAYRNPVPFSNRWELQDSDGRRGNTGKKEILVWILMVVLGIVTITGFYLLWLKAGGE